MHSFCCFYLGSYHIVGSQHCPEVVVLMQALNLKLYRAMLHDRLDEGLTDAQHVLDQDWYSAFPVSKHFAVCNAADICLTDDGHDTSYIKSLQV